MIAANAGNPNPDAPVVDQQVLAGRNGRENFGVGQRNGRLVAVGTRENEADRLSSRDRDLSVPYRAHADLRALEVLQDADGPADVILQRTDRSMNFGVVILRAVAELHTGGVDASHEERSEHIRGCAGGADGGDDLGATVAMHNPVSPMASLRLKAISLDTSRSAVILDAPIRPIRRGRNSISSSANEKRARL